MPLPNGSSPVEHSASFGFWDQRDQPDEVHAQAICDDFAESSFEAPQLLMWLETRCAAKVKEPRFQHLVGVIAPALMDQGELDGALVTELLQRADRLHALNEGTS